MTSMVTTSDRWLRGPLVLAAILGVAAACDDSTGPAAGSHSVSLAFSLTSGAAAPSPTLFAAGLELTDGTNTLVIESAELVIREVEFEKVETAGCDSEIGDDDCGEFEFGPFVVPLNLDGSVETKITAVVEPGFYDEIEFEIHKPEDDDLADQEFIDANPGFADISVRVTGTYNTVDFDYTSDLNAEQEIELISPLEVGAGPVAVTLSIDLDSWFRAPLLIDPNTANKGGVNESVVKDNIQDSIEGFRDDDHDGVPHEDDLDEDDSSDDDS